MRPSISALLFALVFVVGPVRPLPAAPVAALVPGLSTPPDLPSGASAYWRAGTVVTLKGESHVIDRVGANHFVAPAPWFTVSPAGGFALDGTQVEGLRLPIKPSVDPRFTVGVDLCPDAAGTEHQTILNLYRFCELRYRLSKAELTFNVWQTSVDDRSKEVVTSVTLPVPVGRWSRVRAQIEGDKIRLVLDEAKAERRLPGTWEFLPPTVAGIIGLGGADRVYRGRFDHLYLAAGPDAIALPGPAPASP